MRSDDTVLERLADLEHERWARWMRYLFTKGMRESDGRFTIDAEHVKRWERQARDKFHELSPEEREMDRKEARETIAALLECVRDGLEIK